MKALMVNSLNPASIVDNKMRDQLYMKHLRQVEKINNREAEKVTNDVKTYRSINDLHHKHKAYAYYWQNKEEDALIEELNNKMKKKMKEIKSYMDHKALHKQATTQCIQNSRLVNQSPEGEIEVKHTENVDEQKQSQTPKKQKQNHSLHYRYRKRRQEEIDRQNEKLQKGILSQRSSYFPNIRKNRQSISVSGKYRQQKSLEQDEIKEAK